MIEISHIMTDLIGYNGNNALNTKFYNTNRCFVHGDLLVPLNRIQEELKTHGYQLCIIDAYRPLSVQKQIFKIINDTRYVSDPNASRHPRGTAIDVTLYDLNNKECPMPTKLSDFGEKCWANAVCDESALYHRTLLQTIMIKHGFDIYPYEWWHFDFHGWCDDEKYPICDFPL